MKIRLAPGEDLLDSLTSTEGGAFHNQFLRSKLYPILAQHGSKIVSPEKLAMLLLQAFTKVSTSYDVNVFDDLETRACILLGALCGGDTELWRSSMVAWEENWRQLTLMRFTVLQPRHRKLCWEPVRMQIAHPTIDINGNAVEVVACNHTDVHRFVYKKKQGKKEMGVATFDLQGQLLSDGPFSS